MMMRASRRGFSEFGCCSRWPGELIMVMAWRKISTSANMKRLLRE